MTFIFLQLQGYVLWGNHDQDLGKHFLTCKDESLEQGWHHVINMTAQPLLIDANGDYVADIFSSPFNENENFTKTRSIWIYGEDRTKPPVIEYLEPKTQVGILMCTLRHTQVLDDSD